VTHLPVKEKQTPRETNKKEEKKKRAISQPMRPRKKSEECMVTGRQSSCASLTLFSTTKK